MRKIFRKLKKKNEFQPNFLGIFLNPYFILRYNIYKIIKKISYNLNIDKVLDFGCGSKPYQSCFNYKEYIGVDIQNSGHDHKNENIDVFYDGNKIPFNDEYFDFVFSSEVFEHIFNLDKIIKELNRVLKKDGKMLITLPFVWNEHEEPYDYARYTSFAIKEMLNKNGFEIIKSYKSSNFIETIFQKISVYLYQILFPKISFLRHFLILTIIAPINLLGIILGKILPDNKTFYLNNVVLCKKINNKI